MDIDNAYWLAKVFAYYAEEHYKLFNRDTHEFLQRMAIYGRQRVMEIQKGAKGLDDKKTYEVLDRRKPKDSHLLHRRDKETITRLRNKSFVHIKINFPNG